MKQRQYRGGLRQTEYENTPEVLTLKWLNLKTSLQRNSALGVVIEKKEVGGRLTINFFSPDDLRGILDVLNKEESAIGQEKVEKLIEDNREEIAKKRGRRKC